VVDGRYLAGSAALEAHKRHLQEWPAGVKAPAVGPLSAAFMQRIGGVTDEEIRRITPGTGVSVLARAMYIDTSPKLLRYLVDRGARLDAADSEGRSWYWSGYAKRVPMNEQMFAALDVLGVDELRTLIKPVVLLTGQPGKAMERVAERTPGSLGAYLCRRGAISC
jgi:hypothetical protein